MKDEDLARLEMHHDPLVHKLIAAYKNIRDGLYEAEHFTYSKETDVLNYEYGWNDAISYALKLLKEQQNET